MNCTKDIPGHLRSFFCCAECRPDSNHLRLRDVCSRVCVYVNYILMNSIYYIATKKSQGRKKNAEKGRRREWATAKRKKIYVRLNILNPFCTQHLCTCKPRRRTMDLAKTTKKYNIAQKAGEHHAFNADHPPFWIRVTLWAPFWFGIFNSKIFFFLLQRDLQFERKTFGRNEVKSTKIRTKSDSKPIPMTN